jgi:hypothetical protein
MERKVLTLVTFIALAVLTVGRAWAVPTADDPEAWKGLTPDQIAKVKKGEVVMLDKNTSAGAEDQKRFIQAAMIFNQPIDQTWALMKKTELQHRYLPDLENCALVSRNASGDSVDFHVKLVMNINYRIHHVYDDEHCYLHWGLDPNFKNDMKRVDGYWKLYKIDDQHTLARYGTNVEVTSIIPEFIMEKLTKSNLPVNMDACFKYFNSGGTWTKPEFKGK